jgi:glycosyltransferase involved in cell wall biosynthesis
MLVGIPMRIIHSHNNSNEDVGISLVIVIRRFGKFLNKFLLKLSATNYWACSKLAGEWMFGKHPFDIIHNAIDTKKFIYNKELRSIVREKLNLHDEFIIGNVARFSYQKNHEFLIDIFNEIVKRKANSILLLVGDNAADHTYLDMTIAKIKQLHLEKKVIFLGMRKDVNRLYQAMDVFILPSHFEGLPIVGLEAQAAGLRCYFSDTITKELEITNLANYLPLGNAMIWAEKILKEPVYKRCNMEQEIIDRGYDITSEVKKIEDFFLK